MIIGVNGKKGSGKDTFFELFNELYPEQNFTNKKFADKLKQIASMLTGYSLEYFYDRSLYDTKLVGWLDTNGVEFTCRTFMQKFATEGVRDNFCTDTWINTLFADYDNQVKWIITDLRFLNEYNKLREFDSIILKIIPKHESYDSHKSENDLNSVDDWDYIIVNDGTLDDFRNKIKNIFDDILK